MSIKPFTIEQSRTLLNRYDELIIRGCQAHKSSHKMLEMGYPVFTERASGARFWDVDGNEYLDYLMCYGPIVLGHNDPVVNEAVRQQMEAGTVYTTPHPKELDVAEMLIDVIPVAEMVGFFIGGTAATTSARRLARAYTGRERIIRCGYHGWPDWGSAGVPEAIGQLSPSVPYGNLDALEDRFKEYDNQIAGVIIETVQGDVPPEGFLQGCIDIAHRYEALCILDEVKVGFRMAFGGAGEYYNLTPDLATFGKACCNGYPGSFIVGRKDILSTERCQSVWLSATFHCDPVSLVAMRSVIQEIKRRDGIAYQWKIGNRLIEGINRTCGAGGLGYCLRGPGPMPIPHMKKEDRDCCISMLQGCLARGFHLPPSHPMFLSLSHTEEDIENTIVAVEESIADLDSEQSGD